MEQRVRDIMADILHLDPTRIQPSTSFNNTSAWDSLNHINLVAALEEEFGVIFEVQEIEAMISFDKILQILAAKLVH